MRVLFLSALVAGLATSSAARIEVAIEPYNEEYVFRSHFIGEVVLSNDGDQPYDISWFQLNLRVSHSGAMREVCIVRCGRANREYDELILQGGSRIRIPVYIAISDGEFIFPEPGVYEMQAVLMPKSQTPAGIYSSPVSVNFIDGELPGFLSNFFYEHVDSQMDLCRAFAGASGPRVLRSYEEYNIYSRVVEEYLLFQMGCSPIESYVRHGLEGMNREYLREVIRWNRNRTKHEWSKGWVVELFWRALDDHLEGRSRHVEELERVSPRWR